MESAEKFHASTRIGKNRVEQNRTGSCGSLRRLKKMHRRSWLCRNSCLRRCTERTAPLLISLTRANHLTNQVRARVIEKKWHARWTTIRRANCSTRKSSLGENLRRMTTTVRWRRIWYNWGTQRWRQETFYYYFKSFILILFIFYLKELFL